MTNVKKWLLLCEKMQGTHFRLRVNSAPECSETGYYGTNKQKMYVPQIETDLLCNPSYKLLTIVSEQCATLQAMSDFTPSLSPFEEDPIDEPDIATIENAAAAPSLYIRTSELLNLLETLSETQWNAFIRMMAQEFGVNQVREILEEIGVPTVRNHSLSAPYQN